VGIADIWNGDAHSPSHWRDMHYRVQGPVAAQMQAAFMDNWFQANGTMLHGPAYFPPLEAAGSTHAQVFTSSPGGGTRTMQTMYLPAITAARRTIRLSAAYFVPDDVAIETIIAALQRGVRVQIILPGASHGSGDSGCSIASDVAQFETCLIVAVAITPVLQQDRV
jgi:cardiolipin synthase A/B